MKWFKLLVIFAVLGGSLYFILNLVSGSDTKSGMVKPLSFTAEKIKNENHACWNKVTEWDPNLYDKCRQRIHGNEGANHISHENASLLQVDLDQLVIKKIQSFLIQEYSKSDCNGNEILKLMSGYDMLCKTDALNSENSIVKDMRRCYNTYSNISAFVSKSFTLNVVLKDTEDGHSWNSYLKYKDEQLALAANYRNNDDYKTYLSKISKFKNGLDDVSLNSKLMNEVKSFSSELSKQLCAKYSGITQSSVTNADVDHIGNDYTSFCSQYGTQSSYVKNNEADKSLYELYSKLDNWLKP